ncbi:MAG: MFS transporter [Deltaproteobacteria bacterium]|nr:MFS transporter [Deltaproteobacteria bacterium]
MIYGLSTTGYTIIESLVLTFCTVFYLAIEKGHEGRSVPGLVQLVSNRSVGGFITILGLAFLFSRVVDGVADPLIAAWSDRCRSPWGRRRVFLIFSALPLFISSVLVFFPPFPHRVSNINGLYLGLCLGAFFFFFTSYVCPYLSLIPELMPTDRERLRATTVQAACGMLGSALVLIGTWELISYLIESGLYQGTVRIQRSYQTGIVITGLIGLIFLIPPILVIDERRYTRTTPSQTGLWTSLALTLKKRAFVYYIIGNIAFNFAFTVVRTIGAYYVLVLLRGNERDVARYMLAFSVGSVLFFLPVIYLAAKYGKRIMMMLANTTFALFMFLIMFLGKSPFDNKMVLCGLFAYAAFPLAIQHIVANATLSSVAELDARETAQQRQAMFFGVQGLLQKITNGLALVMVGALFSIYGKDFGNDLGVRLSGPFSAIICLSGTYFYYRYPDKYIEARLNYLRGRYERV